jgi:hypothetical protein
MKKNPLSDIYESKVLLNEEKDNVVQDAKKLDAMIDAKKAQPVAGQGADKVKDLEEPEELKKYSDGPKAKEMETLKDSMEAPKSTFEGSFEKLFKATINEDVAEDAAMDMEVEVPASNEEMVDELEDSKDEVSDLVSDLKSVMDHLQSILDKISDEVKSDDSEMGEEEMEFGGEEAGEEAEEKVEEKPMGEATELKPLGDKGKVLMGKNNKVGGSPKVHGGKADGGDVESDPELKPAKAHDKALQNPKAKPEVKSTVKVGEFFK